MVAAPKSWLRIQGLLITACSSEPIPKSITASDPNSAGPPGVCEASENVYPPPVCTGCTQKGEKKLSGCHFDDPDNIKPPFPLCRFVWDTKPEWTKVTAVGAAHSDRSVVLCALFEKGTWTYSPVAYSCPSDGEPYFCDLQNKFHDKEKEGVKDCKRYDGPARELCDSLLKTGQERQ